MKKLLIISILLSAFLNGTAQDSLAVPDRNLSVKYLQAISAESKSIKQKLDKKSQKLLKRLQKQEAKMQAKLAKVDSSAAKRIFENGKEKYDQLESKISNAGNYIPKLDSLATSLKFLQGNPQFLSQAKDVKEKLKDAMAKMDGLKQQLAKAENIKQFIKERKQYLREQLSKFGFAKELQKLNKEVYYYAKQVNEYKEILKDSRKAEKKALELLSKTKLFKDFMRKNSQLASLFRLPNPDDPLNVASVAGLQTRSQVNNLIQAQIAAGGPAARQQFSQNLQAAQAQLQELKNKILKAGGNSSDDIMPDGFKPNNEKTKSFWNRLEYGTNFQSQKANSFFPVTSDIGLSVGYKLNQKSIIGIGASYKVGWGSSFRNIRITQQGVGLRSFIDWKIKGSFWISGGFEMNYKTMFNNISQLQDLNAWQQSGLLGISKTVSIKSKFFKKTKVQLLWDMLSYQQVPRTQPVVFRVGYSF